MYISAVNNLLNCMCRPLPLLHLTHHLFQTPPSTLLSPPIPQATLPQDCVPITALAIHNCVSPLRRPTIYFIDKETETWGGSHSRQRQSHLTSDPKPHRGLTFHLSWDPPVPRSRMPPCSASLQARCAFLVAAEKQRCLRKGCCRNRGKFMGVSRRDSGSSCVWSPESRQRWYVFIHLFTL